MANVPDIKLEEMAKNLSENMKKFPEFEHDKLINQYVLAENDILRKELKQKMIIEANEKPKTKYRH